MVEVQFGSGEWVSLLRDDLKTPTQSQAVKSGCPIFKTQALWLYLPVYIGEAGNGERVARALYMNMKRFSSMDYERDMP